MTDSCNAYRQTDRQTDRQDVAIGLDRALDLDVLVFEDHCTCFVVVYTHMTL